MSSHSVPTKKIDLIVIGAGPAGLIAAITAAERGKHVIICDRMPAPGRKLLATGGGRCNLTNTLPIEEFTSPFGRNARFMLPALRNLNADKLRSFMHKIGVPTHAPDGIHVFPKSHTASTVVNALLKRITSLDIRILCDTDVQQITTEHDATSGIITASGATIHASNILLASGGKGYPQLGSNGSGYRLAEALGHKITPLHPAMVSLLTKETWTAQCTANTLGKTLLTVNLKGRDKLQCQGDIIFTKTGIDGPLIKDISGSIAKLLDKHTTIPVLLNPLHKNPDEFQRELKHIQQQQQNLELYNYLSKRTSPSLAAVLLNQCEISPTVVFNHLRPKQRNRLGELCCRIPLTITQTAGWDKAMVTEGGLSLKDVDPETMQSKKISGLYIAGEVLNLAGPCGGFNLQWAFSSGYTAALHVKGTEPCRNSTSKEKTISN